MPTLEDRYDILKAVSGKLKLDSSLTDGPDSESLREVARRTQGYSGADLQAVMYNAHLEAIHDVLGPGDDLEGQMGASKDSGSKSKAKYRDFSYFRFGDDGAGMADPANAKPAVLAERAAIAAKLSAMETARKRAKQQRHAASQPSHRIDKQTDSDTEDKSQEPVISWRHVVESLKSTRPSNGREEQRRLNAIYREFVVGRNGEMPNGQGGNEIGGRTSLM